MSAVQYNGLTILHINYVLPPSVTSLPPDCITTEWSGYPATKNTRPHRNQPTQKLNYPHQHQNCQLDYTI